MTASIHARGLALRYGSTSALDGVDLDLPGGAIVGLLGRNGAGKTTLLSLLAGYRLPSAGTLTVAGTAPFEDARTMADVCVVGDLGASVHDTWKAGSVLDFAARLRPRWDAAYAARLVDQFEIPLSRRLSALSKGKRSALAIVVGLASRAPVTAFDEAHVGLDAPSRYAFYDELLRDYAEHPRTVLLSTHLVEEAAPLLEDVVILDRGRVLLHEDVDTVRARGVAVTGNAAAVERVITGLPVLAERRLGATASVTVDGQLDDDRAHRARAEGVEVGPVPLQDLFVHLTAPAPVAEGAR